LTQISVSPDTRSFISQFSDLTLADRLTVGGKSASLGELTRAGVAVPPGFVVTTSAFEVFLHDSDPDGRIRDEVAALDVSDTQKVGTASEHIRNRVRDMPMPKIVADEIRNHYRSMSHKGNDIPVAVRSSATCEDSETASFAGLQDTYLWVSGEEQLLDQVRACWASLYNSESITYRQRLDLPEDQISMAVVVQQMVDAACAGVMFTRSPTTGDKSVIVIEGSWGLGSSLVSGEVTPDRFVVNKVTGEVGTRDISEKALEHIPDPSGSGVLERAVEEDRRNTSCLSDEVIAQLWQIARNVEHHYGSPQDIEWAVPRSHGEQKESVFLLQSRPETVWAGREKEPVARPTPKAYEHVLNLMQTRKD
jgi:pyruvate,water dikinase